jgi:hypothetical protein
MSKDNGQTHYYAEEPCVKCGGQISVHPDKQTCENCDKPNDIERWLSPEEYGEYFHLKTHFPEVVDVDYMQTQIKSFEALAEQRELMKKHEWGGVIDNNPDEESCHYCLECGMFKTLGHKPSCRWATAGYPRKVE